MRSSRRTGFLPYRSALSRRSPRGEGGFTLLELILVMALLTIVLSVAMPSLSGFFRGRNLDFEARRFLSLTRYAQSRAASEAIPMVLWVDAGERTYGLQAQTGYLEVDDKAVEYVLDETLEVEVSRAMPVPGLSTAARSEAMSGVGNLPAIRFGADGFIGETSPEQVILRQDDSYTVSITLSGNRLHYEIQARP